jgi:hypothetical protein
LTAIERRRKTGRAIEHSPNLVAWRAGDTETLEQHRRPGQCVGRDPDHSIFDFLGWQPLGAILPRLGD